MDQAKYYVIRVNKKSLFSKHNDGVPHIFKTRDEAIRFIGELAKIEANMKHRKSYTVEEYFNTPSHELLSEAKIDDILIVTSPRGTHEGRLTKIDGDRITVYFNYGPRTPTETLVFNLKNMMDEEYGARISDIVLHKAKPNT